MLLGCVGDDFTGSSDLANTLAKQGMAVTQYVGAPRGPAAPGVEAGVVALKSRTIPAEEAVALSLAALDWLRAQGCRQFFFKYCSTFDSTDAGNIGPVAEALADALDARRVVVCPAFPAAGRTVVHGHLFVGDRLLSESGMKDHPLTPMRDPDLRRVLGRQAKGPVAHLGYAAVRAGAAALRAALDAAPARLVVVDALEDADLMTIGAAVAGEALVTGGSGVAMGLPENFRRAGLLAGAGGAWRGRAGPAAALCGSCSPASRAQVACHEGPKLALDPDAVVSGRITAQGLAAWRRAQAGVPLVYSTADPEQVKAAQRKHGTQAIAEAIEALFAATARAWVADGVERLIVAGGETSGAVVEGLGLRELAIGPEIDPGVPAMRAGDLALTLKSGNFGGPDFFAKAAARLAEGA